jgi:hypothetical protein
LNGPHVAIVQFKRPRSAFPLEQLGRKDGSCRNNAFDKVTTKRRRYRPP